MILHASVGYLVNPCAAIIEKIMTESLVNATPDNPEVREGIGIVERICDKPFRQQIDGDFGNELSAIKPGRGSGYQAIRLCRGGLPTKIHVIVGTAGKVAVLSLPPGQRVDVTEAEILFDEVEPEFFIVGRVYDADPLIKRPYVQQITPVIPSRRNRPNL